MRGVVHVFDLEGHAGLCLVVANRGKREAPGLSRAAYRGYQVASGRRAGGDRGGA
jgi:hypothetical protein